jgi:nucleoside-diphosphate-sugar epimerase
MKERILVTGGAGYIGSILVPDLLSEGYRVTVLDNFMYRQNSLAHLCSNPNFQIRCGDIRDPIALKDVLKSADIVIPLAALVGAPVCVRDPVGAKSINYDAAIALIESASSSQLLLMPITNSAYGSGGEGNFCDEDSPLSPISTYALHKVAVEKALLERPNSISFRLATVFGMSPRMRIDLLVNDFTYRAVHDRFLVLFESHFKRNYIHVRDVSRVFLHGITHFQEMKGKSYNVGLSEANLSKLELCKLIQNHIFDFTFCEAAVGKDPDQRNYVVSNARIEKTGFKHQSSLPDGIIELIKGYQMIRNSVYGNV